MRLTSGADRRLHCFAVVVAVAGIAAVLSSSAGVLLTVCLVSACISACLLLVLIERLEYHPELVLSLDGHAQWMDKESRWCEGVMSANAWSNSHYAVLPIKSGNRTRRFLICRSLQHSGDFRMLLSWLRLGMDRAEY